jgi:hypothetical protein
VTKPGSGQQCRWCGRSIGDIATTGRPKAYCRRSCRQRDYEARRRATELGLGDAELVMARAKLDELHDKLYVLEAAVEDVERDLAGGGPSTKAELREAIDWLLDAARPMRDLLR